MTLINNVGGKFSEWVELEEAETLEANLVHITVPSEDDVVGEEFEIRFIFQDDHKVDPMKTEKVVKVRVVDVSSGPGFDTDSSNFDQG